MSDDKQRDPQHGGRAPGRRSAGIGETDARGVGPDAPSLAATADRTVPDRPADVGRRIRRPGRSRMPDDPSSQPGFEYGNTVYLCARKEAFARSGDLCQLCGQQPAVEAHHWAVDYPPAHKTTAADLTALCAECHFVATTLRRFTRAGGSRHQFRAVLSEVIARCDLNSPLPASPPSSCTTERPDSTREALSAARSQRSRPSEAATEPMSTTSGSGSSSADGPSISTLTADPRYRRQRFGE